MGEIFVFGSNLAGRHGAGSAKHAHEAHGAVYGEGIGLKGRSYAIPTKDRALKTLSLATIRRHVEEFLAYAKAHPELTFNIVDIGCGLAGFKAEQIAPFFSPAPKNCKFLGKLDKLVKKET